MKTDLQTNLMLNLSPDLAVDMIEVGMNSKITALKTNFRTELGSNVADF